LDSELLVGFMECLARVDLDEPRICGRLVEAGVRAARKIREAESDTILIRSGEAGAVLPIRPWVHPDLVLARAVAVAVLDRDEATPDRLDPSGSPDPRGGGRADRDLPAARVELAGAGGEAARGGDRGGRVVVRAVALVP
jgi:hypothetical protein